MSVWFDGEDALDEANLRTIGDIKQFGTGIKRTDREKLSADKKEKFKESCELGLETKFDFFPVPSGEESKVRLKRMDNSYNFHVLIVKFKNALIAKDMECVFQIPARMQLDSTITSRDAWVPVGSERIDLFKQQGEVDLELVKQYSEYVMRRSPKTYLIENMVWSKTKLLNSMTPRLEEQVAMQLDRFEVQHRTGIVALVVMIQKVMDASTLSIRGLADALKDTKITDFDGENVMVYGSLVRGTLEQLSNYESVPADIIEQIKDSLCCSSTAEFNDHVKFTFASNERKFVTLTPEEFIVDAEKQYNKLVFASPCRWALKSPEDDVAFNSEAVCWNCGSDVALYSDNACWNCGSPDHFQRDCPHPIQEETTSGGSAGRGGRGGRGGRASNRGGGRSGRGRGGRFTRGGRGGGAGRGHGGGGDAMTSPPGRGQSHEKMINGRKHYWCGRCSRWTDHSTEVHQQMAIAQAGGEEDGYVAQDEESIASSANSNTGRRSVLQNRRGTAGRGGTNSGGSVRDGQVAISGLRTTRRHFG